MDIKFILSVLLRLCLAVIIGSIVGNERARHARAAGMRTHILVCLGGTMTSLTSIFAATYLGYNGDIFRMAAQVVSGVGFLGAGMIILKGNNTISGLTTAAGVWATAVAGVALGFGFYSGALICTAMLLLALVIFSKFEKNSKNTMILYIEINDAYKVNSVLKNLQTYFADEFKHLVFAPKSEISGNVGIDLVFKKYFDVNFDDILKIDGVVFVIED